MQGMRYDALTQKGRDRASKAAGNYVQMNTRGCKERGRALRDERRVHVHFAMYRAAAMRRSVYARSGDLAAGIPCI